MNKIAATLALAVLLVPSFASAQVAPSAPATVSDLDALKMQLIQVLMLELKSLEAQLVALQAQQATTANDVATIKTNTAPTGGAVDNTVAVPAPKIPTIQPTQITADDDSIGLYIKDGLVQTAAGTASMMVEIKNTGDTPILVRNNIQSLPTAIFDVYNSKGEHSNRIAILSSGAPQVTIDGDKFFSLAPKTTSLVTVRLDGLQPDTYTYTLYAFNPYQSSIGGTVQLPFSGSVSIQ